MSLGRRLKRCRHVLLFVKMIQSFIHSHAPLCASGIVASLAPLMGASPAVDKNVTKWLHVHVRPSIRGLLRVLRSLREGSGAKKGGIVGAMRQLADGHWVLAFPDADRASTASLLVRRNADRLRSCYTDLLVAAVSAA